MDDLMVIGLYRHGITKDNERKAFSGWTDSVISERGKKELRQIQPLLPFYEKVSASDLQRCLDTASFLFPSSSTDKWPEFREINFGLWEGKVHRELEHMDEYRSWLLNPLESPVPGGESYLQFSSRISGAWRKWIEELNQLSVQRAALVTHGGVIRQLLMNLAPEKKEFWEWRVENGRGYELTGLRSAFRKGERCISLQEVPSTARNNG